MRTALGGGLSFGVGVSASAGVGGGKDVANYIQIHKFLDTLHVEGTGAGLVAMIGGGASSYTSGTTTNEPDYGTTDVEIGVGALAERFVGKDIEVKLTLSGTVDGILLKTFVGAVKSQG
jgi:hypothetical protein